MKSTLICCLIAATFVAPLAQAKEVRGNQGSVIDAVPVATFNSPWAMTFLSDTQALVTTKGGVLWLVSNGAEKVRVSGVPKVVTGGQGGLGDVILHPDFARNGLIYLSFVGSDNGGKTRGAEVVRAKLTLSPKPNLTNVTPIWKQTPKVRGKGHFSHRLAFDKSGKLFITSGDRQMMDPAQDWNSSLGKVIRINADGSVPNDNPFQDKGELAKTFWSVGHRNPLGIAFDANGRLWSTEMGPRHGDELNVVNAGANYGWPLVSEGNHYSGQRIPNHNTQPQFAAPKAAWVPSIAPAGLVIYDGAEFPTWKGNAFIAGLKAQALIRVTLKGTKAQEAERFEWGVRIREVEQAPDGALWVLEDGKGRLLRLTKP